MSGVFLLLICLRNRLFAVFIDHFTEEEISDYTAHAPIIRVLMVIGMVDSVMKGVMFGLLGHSISEHGIK